MQKVIFVKVIFMCILPGSFALGNSMDSAKKVYNFSIQTREITPAESTDKESKEERDSQTPAAKKDFEKDLKWGYSKLLSLNGYFSAHNLAHFYFNGAPTTLVSSTLELLLNFRTLGKNTHSSFEFPNGSTISTLSKNRPLFFGYFAKLSFLNTNLPNGSTTSSSSTNTRTRTQNYVSDIGAGLGGQIGWKNKSETLFIALQIEGNKFLVPYKTPLIANARVGVSMEYATTDMILNFGLFYDGVLYYGGSGNSYSEGRYKNSHVNLSDTSYYAGGVGLSVGIGMEF